MRIALIASTIAIYTLVSCGSQDDVDISGTPESSALTTTPALGTEASTTTPGTVATPTPAVKLNPAHGQPGHRCDISVGAPLDGSSAPAAATTTSLTSSPRQASSVNIPLNLKGLTALGQPGGAGLNPAHGKPGHRCDIAVGAPLNSAPAANTAQAIPASSVPTAAPVIQAPAVSAQNTSTSISAASGLNPQHGQPGHRCDIAVGAPLNSKPTATSAAKTQAPAVTAVAPGMNPQHGQPGHRCDIAVGAPLNSKPAASPAPIVTPVIEAKKDSTGS
ncbi:MAG TPA: hypothetical protein VK166_10510 [Chitinophagaceae bacterium]|nr:hypothetical protein [Chitinophagaceae bacterium]